MIYLGVYILIILSHAFTLIRDPFSHLLRPVHGIIIIALILVEIAYFFTWILEGFTETAIVRAQYSVVITFFMLLWALFAGITLLGIYFAYSVQYGLFGWSDHTFNTPFILYMGDYNCINGDCVWFTFTVSWRILLKKKIMSALSFDSQVIVSSLILGSVLFVSISF
jgi:hypothetical protein